MRYPTLEVTRFTYAKLFASTCCGFEGILGRFVTFLCYHFFRKMQIEEFFDGLSCFLLDDNGRKN